MGWYFMRNAQEIAILIKAELKSRKITAAKMLSDTGLSPDVLANMQKGSMPSADKLGKIAQYLDISTDYLLGLVDG